MRLTDDWATPAGWERAEQRLARPLAQLTGLFARLDERLGAAQGAEDRDRQDADAALTRLAGEEAVALARAEGARLSLDAFLLWRYGAPLGRTDPSALARAGWAARRLAAPSAADAAMQRDPEGLRAFLGRDGPVSDLALQPFLDRIAGAQWAEAAEAFCADLKALSGLSPLTRAAAASLFWRLGGLGTELEGAVLAARCAAGADADADDPTAIDAGHSPIASSLQAVRPGLRFARFLPLGMLPRARKQAGGLTRAGRTAPAASGFRPHLIRTGLQQTGFAQAGFAQTDVLAALLQAGLARLPPLLAGLTRRRGWRAYAASQIPGVGVAPAVLDVLARETLVSANLLRDRLGVSQQAANAALTRLAERGLIEEVSGQRRYRLWRARL